MSINYCNCKGLMAQCEVAGNFVRQQFCEFAESATPLNKTKERYCMHLGKVVENHCDNAAAQWDAKCGKKEDIAPLSEEDIFDIRSQETYPEYGITY